MDKTQLLERYFNAFIELKEPRDFFVGMTDYLDLANSFTEFENIDKDITAPQKRLEKEIFTLREEALKKLLVAYKDISEYIEKNKIKDEAILEDLLQCKAWNNGWITGGNSKPIGLHISLGDVVDCLYKMPEHKEFASKYVELYKGNPDLVNRFVPIKEVWELMDLENEFKAKEDTELWGHLGYISRLYETIKYGRDIHKTLKERQSIDKNTKNTFDVMGHGMILQEWKSINEDSRFGQKRDRYFYKVDKTKPWLSRLHNYLLKELTLKKDKLKDIAKSVSFDSEKSRLTVNNKSVVIRKFSEQYHSLRVMFEDATRLNDEWFFSELGDLIDMDKRYTNKQFHNYFSAIKRRVSTETGIKDLFITTNQSVRINPDYVKSE